MQVTFLYLVFRWVLHKSARTSFHFIHYIKLPFFSVNDNWILWSNEQFITISIYLKKIIFTLDAYWNVIDSVKINFYDGIMVKIFKEEYENKIENIKCMTLYLLFIYKYIYIQSSKGENISTTASSRGSCDLIKWETHEPVTKMDWEHFFS